MPESRSIARRLAAFVGAAATELGIRAGPTEIEAEVLALIEDPVGLYEAHASWPSLLTDSGLPVELSLKVGRGRDAALRCVADVADHRAQPADNRSRYFEYAANVIGKGGNADDVSELCRLHLHGVPSSCRSQMIHGLGYAPSDWRRGSLYFRTGWLRREQLSRRLPEHIALLAETERRYGCSVAETVEVMGYDFVPGQPLRAKAYTWPPIDRVASFGERVGRHPDLRPAREVFEAFRDDVNPSIPHPLLLQTSREDGSVHQRLFFFGSAWRWSDPGVLGRLLHLLHERLGINLAALSLLADAAATNNVPVKLSMVALGMEQGSPSATLYFWPTVASPTAPGHSPDALL